MLLLKYSIVFIIKIMYYKYTKMKMLKKKILKDHYKKPEMATTYIIIQGLKCLNVRTAQCTLYDVSNVRPNLP